MLCYVRDHNGEKVLKFRVKMRSYVDQVKELPIYDAETILLALKNSMINMIHLKLIQLKNFMIGLTSNIKCMIVEHYYTNNVLTFKWEQKPPD